MQETDCRWQMDDVAQPVIGLLQGEDAPVVDWESLEVCSKQMADG